MRNPELANGAPVLDWALRKGRTGEMPLVGKVLAHLPHNDLHPFVVWTVAGDGFTEPMNAFSGDYHTDLDEAKAAFGERRV